MPRIISAQIYSLEGDSKNGFIIKAKDFTEELEKMKSLS